MRTIPSHLRAAPPFATLLTQLGPLAELSGTWVGNGFNLVALPNGQNKNTPLPFFLKLNTTKEILQFSPIGGLIPDRGFSQGDIFYVGLHYLQQVSDNITNEGMHIEPGLWLNLPATTAPSAVAGVARLGTIPHGNALLAQGPLINGGKSFAGPPKFVVEDSTPFTINVATGARVNETNATYLAAYQHPVNLPPGITAAIVANPNIVLQNALTGQTVINTTVIQVSANPVGGIQGTPITKTPTLEGNIGNIPFITTNANANSMSAILWIEVVTNPSVGQFIQLQYSQTVILEFAGIKWPHISVATLVKQ